MLIITGLGRSGTSFIAEIFHNLSYEMGEYNPQIDAGFENPEITTINKLILSGDWWNTEAEQAKMREVAEKYYVAKDPRFMITLGTWLKSGVKIDGAIHCKRNLTHIVDSSTRTHAGLMALWYGNEFLCQEMMAATIEYLFVTLCEQNYIPIYPLWYSESLKHWSYLTRYLELFKVTEEQFREVWINTIRRKESEC